MLESRGRVLIARNSKLDMVKNFTLQYMYTHYPPLLLLLHDLSSVLLVDGLYEGNIVHVPSIRVLKLPHYQLQRVREWKHTSVRTSWSGEESLVNGTKYVTWNTRGEPWSVRTSWSGEESLANGPNLHTISFRESENENRQLQVCQDKLECRGIIS